MRALVLVVLCALGTAVAAAQDTAIVIQPESAGIIVLPPELPHAVAEDAVRRYNAATTTRLVGRSRLPHGNEWRGDVAVRNGTVVVRAAWMARCSSSTATRFWTRARWSPAT